MIHCGTKTLETDREAMFRNWASDPEVTKFLTWPTHESVDTTKYVLGLWLQEYEKNDYYHWAITLKENGDEAIGTIHGLVNDSTESIQVGYCLGRAFWHQGARNRSRSDTAWEEPSGIRGLCRKHCRRSWTFSLKR